MRELTNIRLIYTSRSDGFLVPSSLHLPNVSTKVSGTRFILRLTHLQSLSRPSKFSSHKFPLSSERSNFVDFCCITCSYRTWSNWFQLADSLQNVVFGASI